MKLLREKVSSKFNLYLLSDIHKGTLAHHEDGFHEAIETIRVDRGARVVIGGDLTEAICTDDKRFDFDSVDPTIPNPIQQWQRVAEELMPIKTKIAAINTGNHDRAHHRHGNGVRDIVCKDLGIRHKYGTYSCKVAFHDKHGLIFKVFITHGSRSITSTADDPIRREANEKLILKRHLKPIAADCLIMWKGHAHKLIISPPEKELYLNDDGEKIRQHYTTSDPRGEYIHPDHRYYFCTGGFLKLYGPEGTDTYVERAEYPPAELGYIKVRIEDRQVVGAEKVFI